MVMIMIRIALTIYFKRTRKSGQRFATPLTKNLRVKIIHFLS